MQFEDLHFPHDSIRPIQKEMITDIYSALEKQQDCVLHAPTGIGKTASVLAPALRFASQHNLKVFFLTSRHTQHHIVIDTLKQIKKKHGVTVGVADLIGKKGMCAQSKIELVPSSEFHEYCKKLREDNLCEFYLKTKKKTGALTVGAQHTINHLRTESPCHIEQINEESIGQKLCPYEVALELAKKATVIVADYYYIFNPGIQQSFLKKIESTLDKCIIVVDEAHNLPSRIREISSVKLSDFVLDAAIKESRKQGDDSSTESLEHLQQGMKNLLDFDGEEKKVDKNHVMSIFGDDYAQVQESLEDIGDLIREKQKRSFIGSVAHFLTMWEGGDEGHVRILSKQGDKWNLSYRCLDPSLHTQSIVNDAYSTIMMSGTLKPTSMYHDLMGLPSSFQKEYPNPFPKNNRLTLVVPKTTTKFSRRSESQFKDIAVMCAGLIDHIPGKTAIFFPSYFIRDQVFVHLSSLLDHELFIEKPGWSKEQKKELVLRFSQAGNGTLLGISSGSFGEGLDMPGVLKGVIVVGLPLHKPDLETKSLIDYYETKFGKGWDYGYVFPAITKCLQNAGRCIRSEKDKGVMVFLDERYAWKSYLSCFPKDWDMKIETNFPELLDEFF